MKKNMFKFSFLLALCGLSLTSCDTKNDENQTEPKEVTATVEYSIPDRYDLPKYFDMMVYYTNSEGKEVSEEVTSTTWKKTITKALVPGTYEMKLGYTRNKAALTQESYKFGKGLKISYTTSTGAIKSGGGEGSSTVSKAQVDAFLEKITTETISEEIAK